MPATLKVAHKAIGAEVRRGTYDVVVDGTRAGTVELNGTFETPVDPGRHTLQIRNGRNSSRTAAFDAAEGQVIAFRCSGKNILPIFLLSFLVPSLAISLRRELPATRPASARESSQTRRVRVDCGCVRVDCVLRRHVAAAALVRRPEP